ncbi:MmcQ/YjbR family DNA-binding protein [Levilactobacillus namurensis]|uniref:MmcQ/YjbR family DNA-binding protein n=1 Tax=Levilactobacillus namurensis TaxID=380393 RepID=A0AAW8W4J6_9LACO|nr:MmcQ/YjbR family DNA-binding protein [Levilactobacillus namurensis]MDT7013704.1 MmcQ/YjbR family DNA-binding protein [Levilactobacillus namurensis]
MELTRQEVVQLLSESHSVVVDQRFTRPGRRNLVVFDAVRHAATRKIFALVYTKDHQLYVDLKQALTTIADLVESSPAITLGQHFDKQHWITVNVTALSSRQELQNLALVSYHLSREA